MPLKPFFSYYGSKYRSAKLHPKPYHETIIEPFAGSACYSLYYGHDRKVILNDLSEVIYGMWDYLIRVDEAEFLKLPDIVNHIDEVTGPQEAKWLIGSWFAVGRAKPVLKPTSLQTLKRDYKDITVWNRYHKILLSQQLKHIRHWKIQQKGYQDCPDIDACWFIDPPYHRASRPYMTPKFTEYEALGKWSKERKGMVIVCENSGAEWLPFRPFKRIHGANGATDEVVYYQNCSRLLNKT